MGNSVTTTQANRGWTQKRTLRFLDADYGSNRSPTPLGVHHTRKKTHITRTTKIPKIAREQRLKGKENYRMIRTTKTHEEKKERKT